MRIKIQEVTFFATRAPKTDFSGSFAVVFLKNDHFFRMNEIRIQTFLQVGFGLESGCKSGRVRVRVGLNEFVFSGSGSGRVGKIANPKHP